MDACWIILLVFLSLGVLLMLRGMLRREFLGKRSAYSRSGETRKENTGDIPDESEKT